MSEQQTSADTMTEAPVIRTDKSRVSCNGGGGALGHPQIWLTLGEDGQVVCPYCSAIFVKADTE